MTFVQIFRALFWFWKFHNMFFLCEFYEFNIVSPFFLLGFSSLGVLSDITRNGVRVVWVLKIVHSSALKWGEFQVIYIYCEDDQLKKTLSIYNIYLESVIKILECQIVDHRQHGLATLPGIPLQNL